jgi:hypothetical protein
VWVEFVFPDDGPWNLRPWLYGTGEFGESLRIDVAQN